MAMTRDDIIQMAREAGATRDHPKMLPNFWTLTNPDLERFANLVAAAEREECAKRLDAIGCDHCATNIRLRGQ
jgi:hypothetical protein